MTEVKAFGDIDRLCLEARKHFRRTPLQSQTEVEWVFNLCLDLFRSIGKFRKPEDMERQQGRVHLKRADSGSRNSLGNVLSLGEWILG